MIDFKKNQYEDCKRKCDSYFLSVLSSNSLKKVIIAKPGTGKSFLFSMICEEVQKKNKGKILVLSFINELVDDLTKDLYLFKNAEVKTLHSFALSQISKNNRKYYLNIESIIEQDYEIIKGKKINFDKILCNLIEDKDALTFYLKRRKYYGFFGPNCSVYSLVKYFERNKDKIPEYSQILIDEFQDFNKLESKLIDLLSEKSPVLIVGDDDQSLYTFRYANPKEIRVKNMLQEYTSFELPFCRRCPRVIIDAFNSILDKAKQKDYLAKRADKQFKYFVSEKKDKISEEYQKIVVKRKVYQTAVAYNIEQEIDKIFNPKEKDDHVLIICSSKKQISDLAKRLREKGFNNIQIPKENEDKELNEGFNLLLKDKDCNLGWRIVSKYILDNKLSDIVQKCYSENNQAKFKDLLSPKDRKKIKSLLTILRKINKGKQVTEEESEEIINCFGYKPNQIVLKKIKNNLQKNKFPKKINKDVPIKITNILGSKGLTSDYVFLVNFDDRYILNKGNKITDENICRFLVSLTRARKRIYIYTSQNNLPTFVDWIDKKFIEVN